MKKEVGLWIDHRRAVIVINLDQEEEIKQIASNIEKHVRYLGGSRGSNAREYTSEDGRDRRFDMQLSHFYDEIITYLRDATSILIMGPGEAKGELQKHLEGQELSGCIVSMKTADRMTNQQIAASIHQHFHESQPGSDRTTQQYPTKHPFQQHILIHEGAKKQ